MLLTAEATPFATCIKKNYEVFYHLKDPFNMSYIAKNKKTFSDFSGLLQLSGKLGVGLREKYSNEKRE